MKGDFVIVRTMSGPRVCRVTELDDGAIYVSSPDQYALIIKGLPALDPVGFPLDAVFEYNQEMEKEVALGKINWKRLRSYASKTERR